MPLIRMVSHWQPQHTNAHTDIAIKTYKPPVFSRRAFSPCAKPKVSECSFARRRRRLLACLLISKTLLLRCVIYLLDSNLKWSMMFSFCYSSSCFHLLALIFVETYFYKFVLSYKPTQYFLNLSSIACECITMKEK